MSTKKTFKFSLNKDEKKIWISNESILNELFIYLFTNLQLATLNTDFNRSMDRLIYNNYLYTQHVCRSIYSFIHSFNFFHKSIRVLFFFLHVINLTWFWFVLFDLICSLSFFYHCIYLSLLIIIKCA